MITTERRRAEEFLQTHLPQSDLDCYPPALLGQFLDHALMLRATVPWCGMLDWEIFAHYVLFPRVNDEDLSFHRELFYRSLWPRVKDLPTQEARVLEVNRWCHEHASYQAQDERTASPLTVFRCGSGRCGEESAFLVAALRSVGIAARQVYVPRWSHCDDNHAWVEALCGNTWHFLGACEPEPVLDRGWFTTAASRAVLVHSRIFGDGASPLHGELLGRDGPVTWFSQTARYAAVKSYCFQALLQDARPASGAEFELQVLNGAAFCTVAVLTADAAGRACARLGAGSLHVLAHLNGLAAEGERGENGVVLRLTPPDSGNTGWTAFDFHPPADRRPAPAMLSDAQKAERARTLRRGNALRQKRFGMSCPGPAGCEDLLLAARGNKEIAVFLAGSDNPDRERLVRTLTDKALRDATAEVLEDHLAHLPPRSQDTPEHIYWRYVACPQIALEPLTSWRGLLRRRLAGFQGMPPSALWAELEERLETQAPAYGGLYWTPKGALRFGRCDDRSKYLLLVAALRTSGIPARLRPLDSTPEYWSQGGFRTVFPVKTATLTLTAPPGKKLQAGQDWSISRRVGPRWRLLTPEEEWQGNELRLTLPAGRYRLLTSVRLPAGDQLAARCELVLSPGDERTVPLKLRPWVLENLLSRQSLPVLPAAALTGARVPDLFRTGAPVLALWLEEGGEPTEHLLNELTDLWHAGAAFPVPIAFLLRSRDSLKQPTLAQALAQLDGIQVLLDDWAYDLESVARQLGRDPDAAPLAVLSDGMGQAVYSVSGYRVGSARLLLQVAARLAEAPDVPFARCP